jgi:hypothetical protein
MVETTLRVGIIGVLVPLVIGTSLLMLRSSVMSSRPCLIQPTLLRIDPHLRFSDVDGGVMIWWLDPAPFWRALAGSPGVGLPAFFVPLSYWNVAAKRSR